MAVVVLSLALFDLDSFKGINDEHGQEADRALYMAEAAGRNSIVRAA